MDVEADYEEGEDEEGYHYSDWMKEKLVISWCMLKQYELGDKLIPLKP